MTFKFQALSTCSFIISYSMFSELRSSAKREHPQSSVEQFLDLRQVLERATAVADALAGMDRLSKEPLLDVEEHPLDLTEELRRLYLEKAKRANLWVGAALSTDLASFTVMMKQVNGSTSTKAASSKKEGSKGTSPSQYMLVLEKGSMEVKGTSLGLSKKSTSSGKGPKGNESGNGHVNGNGEGHGNSNGNGNGNGKVQSDRDAKSNINIPKISVRRLSNGTPTKSSNMKSSKKDTPITISQAPEKEAVSWVKGSCLRNISDLANNLQAESRTWFLEFLEGALDCGFQVSLQQDNGQIAAMLSQLKRVNDWLDHVNSSTNGSVSNEVNLSETVARLKQKIYEFLLQHVESAALALENQVNV